MSTGLVASTVTPGSTAPDGSRTTPAMPLAACWAQVTGARDAVIQNAVKIARPLKTDSIVFRSGVQCFIVALLCASYAPHPTPALAKRAMSVVGAAPFGATASCDSQSRRRATIMRLFTKVKLVEPYIAGAYVGLRANGRGG